MPNIREFTNPIDHLTPDNGMEQVAARNAQHTEGVYHQLGQEIGQTVNAAGDAYDRIKTQQDMSHGMFQYTNLYTQKQQEWDQTIKQADPNDPTVAGKWADQNLKPALDQWVSGFSTQEGQKWAQDMAGRMYSELTHQAIGDQSHMAGAAAVSNLDMQHRSLTGMMFEHPENLPNAKRIWTDAIEATISQHPNLTPDQVASFRSDLLDKGTKEIGIAAAEGAARRNPSQFLTELADPNSHWHEYLTGEEENQAVSFAESQARVHAEDARTKQQDQIRQQKLAAGTAMSQLYAAGIGKGPNGEWAPPPDFLKSTVDLVIQYPQGVDVSEIHAMQSYVQTYNTDAASGRTVVDDPKIANGMFDRMAIGQGQPGALSRTEILQAAANRQISNHTKDLLIQSVEKINSDPSEKHLQTELKAFTDSKKSAILGANGLMGGGPSPEASERYYDFKVAMQGAIQAYRTANPGATPAQVESDLLNPASKNYLGRQNTLWMHYYSTGQLPPGQTPGNRPLQTAPGSSIHPAGQPRPPAPHQPPAGPAPNAPSLDDLAKQ